MERRLYGGLEKQGIEVVERAGRRFVRYDAGAHQIAMREDEITPEEFELIAAGVADQAKGMLQLRARLAANGMDAYMSNWPSQHEA